MRFKVGDVVRWKSHGGGHTTTKTGKVVCTMPWPGTNPIKVCNEHFPKHKRMFTGRTSDGSPYLVEVIVSPNKAPRLYKPKAKLLKLVGS